MADKKIVSQGRERAGLSAPGSPCRLSPRTSEFPFSYYGCSGEFELPPEIPSFPSCANDALFDYFSLQQATLGIWKTKDENIWKTKDENGIVKWYKYDRLHRDDGLAVECPWYKAWYKDGLRHRTDGPAYILDDKASGQHYEGWCLYGKLIPKGFFLALTQGPENDLITYLGKGCDRYIEERLKAS